MADVQLEYGHVRIANRLFEAILDADFTGAQTRILIALIRLTYGWRRRTVTVTIPELAAFCQLQPVGGFRRALRDLVREGVVLQLEHDKGRSATTYAIQKDFMAWGRYSVAEARLAALWHDRPASDDDLLADRVTRQGPPPAQDDPTGSPGTTLQGPSVRPHRVTLTVDKACEDTVLASRKDSERQGKPENEVIETRETALTRLVVMANKGLAEHPQHPQPIAGVLVGQASAAEATDDILQAGVPLEFAAATVYELARTHRAGGPIRSLKYFSGGVVHAWIRAQATAQAAEASAPAHVGTDGPRSAVDEERAWSDALDLVRRLSRHEVSATEYATLDPRLRAGLKAVGGWTALRDARPNDLPFRRRDFLAAYRAAPTPAAVPPSSSTRVLA